MSLKRKRENNVDVSKSANYQTLEAWTEELKYLDEAYKYMSTLNG